MNCVLKLCVYLKRGLSNLHEKMLCRFIKLEVNIGLAWNGLAQGEVLIFTIKDERMEEILPRVKNCRNGGETVEENTRGIWWYSSSKEKFPFYRVTRNFFQCARHTREICSKGIHWRPTSTPLSQNITHVAGKYFRIYAMFHATRRKTNILPWT